MPSVILSDISFTAIHRETGLVGEFVERLREEEPNWRVGISARLPRHRRKWLERHVPEWAESAGYVFLDPECALLRIPVDKRGGGRKDWSYLHPQRPYAAPARLVRDCLDAQIEVGCEVLISPWAVCDAGRNSASVRSTLDLASRAMKSPAAEDHTLLVGLEATSALMTVARDRDTWLDAVVNALDGAPIYLRMAVPSTSTGYAQSTDEYALEGLFAAIESLTANDHKVVLGQTGLVGWLLLAAGANAFGSGVIGSLQRAALPKVDSRSGPSKVNWYFCPQLLGYVRSEDMALLAKVEGFRPCRCPYCDGRLPKEGILFRRVEADKHYLWWCAALTDEIRRSAPDKRRAKVEKRVKTALEFWAASQEAGVPLPPGSRPTHLPVWARILAGA